MGLMSPSILLLRVVRESDAAALHPLFFPSLPWPIFQAQFARWQQNQARDRLVYLVGEYAGQLVAQGQLVLLNSHKAEIAHLEVAAAYRQLGFGSQLIQTLVNLAQARQVTCVEICVAQTNSRAYALYQRLGFRLHRALFSATDDPGWILQLRSEG